MSKRTSGSPWTGRIVAGMIVACAVAPVPLAGQTPADTLRYELRTARSRVWFEAEASMGRFEGDAGEVRGWAELTNPAGLGDARGRVEVPVAALETGLGMRDRHLRETMEADRFPLVTLELDGVERRGGAASDAASDSIAIHGILTIKTTSRPVRIPATMRRSGDTLQVRGRRGIRLTDYGIDPPSRLLGLARMHDALTIAFDAVFVRRPR